MFCEKLKKLRENKGLSQKDLSIRLGFKSPNVMGMYERGEREPNLETLRKISIFFNVSIDYLLDNKYPELSPEAFKIATDIEKLSPNKIEAIKRLVSTMIEV